MIARIVTDVQDEPIGIEECRRHLGLVPYGVDENNVPTHPDDPLILALLAAARQHCEHFTGIALASRTYEVAFDGFPASSSIVLGPSPVASIESVTITAEIEGLVLVNGLIDPADYYLDLFDPVPTLRPTIAWPAVGTGPRLILIRYIAGYDAATLPPVVRAAILLVLRHLYENREAAVERALSLLPLGVHELLWPLRMRLGMA